MPSVRTSSLSPIGTATNTEAQAPTASFVVWARTFVALHITISIPVSETHTYQIADRVIVVTGNVARRRAYAGLSLVAGVSHSPYRVLGSREDFHSHDSDAALSEVGQLGEPFLHVRLGVVRIKISLIGVDLEEDEMAWSLAVFLEEIDEVLRVASDQSHQWQRGSA